jgi:transcriptional regulator NrdR family protein
MLCPKCKSANTKEISLKFIKQKNFNERLRKCYQKNCLHIFTTTEKVIQRKIESRTLWKEYRFEEYAYTLMDNVGLKLIEHLKTKKLLERFLNKNDIFPDIDVNKKGVITFQISTVKNKKIGKLISQHNVRGLKSLTIRQILKKKSYWEKYAEIFKKEATEEIKTKEKDQFLKSIIHPETGISSKKYDLDFFKKSKMSKDKRFNTHFEAFWRIWKRIS